MRPHLLIAAAAAAFALPVSMAAAQGAADPNIDAFRSICWNSAGDYVATVKAADADGWKDTQVVTNADDGVSVTDKAAREKAGQDGDMTMLVTRGLRHTKSGQDIKVDTCKLTINKPDAGLIGASQAWVGAAPDSGDATLAVYYVKPGAGQPDHLAASQLNAALGSGGLGILKFQQDSDATTMVYQVYSK